MTQVLATDAAADGMAGRVPSWARWAAHAVALTAVPSGLWRVAMAADVPVGFSEAGMRAGDIPGWGSVWPILLSPLVEGLALLTLGLVRPWGEVLPRWIPMLGGRPVPPLAAVIPRHWARSR
ncbi:hypothetical protein [Crossiella sp. NPDC003009]